MENWFRTYEKLLETQYNLIYRWVDSNGAKSYIRQNKIVGRTRHWLPKEITELDKRYAKTGISFSSYPNKWNAHGNDGICFVINKNKLPNFIYEIDGDAVYKYTQALDNFEVGDVNRLRDEVVIKSKNNPDETFVIGNITNLSDYVEKIIVPDKLKIIVEEYCKKHKIVMEVKHENKVTGPF